MKGRLGKTTAIALVCYCRQAERSVDRVLTAPNCWPDFVAYYDEQKRAAIMDLIAILKRAGAVDDQRLAAESLQETTLVALMRSLSGPLVNRIKQAWSFSTAELSFVCRTLDTLLRILEHSEPPKSQELVDLRMDLWMCQDVVYRKMRGVTELRDAERIEHFYQPEFTDHVTLEQMGVHSPKVSI